MHFAGGVWEGIARRICGIHCVWFYTLLSRMSYIRHLDLLYR